LGEQGYPSRVLVLIKLIGFNAFFIEWERRVARSLGPVAGLEEARNKRSEVGSVPEFHIWKVDRLENREVYCS
jgi:hypothetical protein